MSTERFEIIGKAKKVIQQIGLELAFVDSVKENGIDGINDLVRQLETILGGEEPEQIRAGMDAVRQWIDERVAIDNKLSSVCIARLGDWQPWIDAAVMSWEYQLSYPTLPEGWKTPEENSPAPVGDSAAAVAPGGHASQATPAARPAARAVELLPEQTVDIVPPDSDLEMLQLFCAEAQDLLQDIEQGVLVLEVNPTDSSSLDSLFRAFHTFKGNVGVMKLLVLQQLAHELESMLDAARRGKYQLGSDSITVILAGSDILKRFVTELSNQIAGVDAGRTIDLPIPQLIHDVHSLLAAGSSAPAAASPAAVTPVPAAPHTPATPQAPAAVAAAVEAESAAIFAAPTPFHQAEPARSEPASAGPAAVLAARAAPAAPAAKKPAANQQASAPAVGSGIVRVDTVKLDGLIDLVGELVIAQSMVVQNPELKAITSAHLSRCLGQLHGITSDLQRTAMSLRMVPIRNTFQKMSRLVRDLALQQGKEIVLSLEGEDTELDRNIVEELSDPLVHMIRNSADHGIEMPDVRVAAGKPPAGTITLRAFHQGGFIVIQIEDDGRGLNAAKIRKKAIERGIIRADENLDEREIFDLIFAAGFSTAEKVTDLSGRGVGMDVVRRNIEKMRGKIEISSIEGEGTTFTLYVPLTLAIIEGLLVGIGEERYVIPTLSVRESFRPLPGMVTQVQGRGEVVSVRGRLTPILRLGRHLNTPHTALDPTQGIIVVVEAGQDSRCLLVDQLIGKQEVVIKSLGEMFRHQTEFAGAAILGDGRVGLILDINALVKLKSRNGEAA
ncbi:MAG: chemotaxis protein CheA [Planctomycetaceae bacterium]|nr:chemotaxis protein CheA [Planctomycetaceae bacterium]